MQLQLGAGHNDRTTRKVDALTQKVLTEATLLTFQHVGQRFQRTLVGTRDHAATTAVVEQCIHGFLQHPLFVPHDDIGRAQFDKTLETIVPVDHAAVQIVQIRGRETTTIEWHKWAQFWWDHGDHSQNHPLRTVT